MAAEFDQTEAVERINKERVELRLENYDLYKAAGISRQCWWRVKNDPTKLSLKVLGKLEDALAAKRAERAAA